MNEETIGAALGRMRRVDIDELHQGSPASAPLATTRFLAMSRSYLGLVAPVPIRSCVRPVFPMHRPVVADCLAAAC
jgi:hypothetical protein